MNLQLYTALSNRRRYLFYRSNSGPIWNSYRKFITNPARWAGKGQHLRACHYWNCRAEQKPIKRLQRKQQLFVENRKQGRRTMCIPPILLKPCVTISWVIGGLDLLPSDVHIWSQGKGYKFLQRRSGGIADEGLFCAENITTCTSMITKG